MCRRNISLLSTFSLTIMSFNVAGKVAFVTGGASGIGLSIVKALLQHGAVGVAIIDVNLINGKQVEDELKKTFGKTCCIFIECNVAKPKQLEDAFDLTIATFKQLDIVVNNAGIVEEDDWQRCVAVNLGGCIAGTRLALEKYLPLHKSGQEGVILNNASILGIIPSAVAPIYATTKFGILGLSQSYGEKEFYEKTNVKVLTLCPSFTDTAIVPEDQRNEFQSIIQPTEHVGESAITVIQNGRSGTVWIVRNSMPVYQESFPVRNYLPS